MDAKLPFSDAVNALVAASQTTAVLPGAWQPAQHSYGDGKLKFQTSADGVWSVERTRNIESAKTELFVSRMAALAGVPVAPVFIADKDSPMSIMSVIPFKNVIHSNMTARLPIDEMRSYLQHSSSSLPFFLWMGENMDRDTRNVCINADNTEQFAEFDFDKGSLTMLMIRARFADADDIHELDEFSKVTIDDRLGKKPILRKAFADALETLTKITPQQIDSIINVVHDAAPFSDQQRQVLKDNLAKRLAFIDMAFKAGQFDRYMVDTLPDLPPIKPEVLAQSTYRFP